MEHPPPVDERVTRPDRGSHTDSPALHSILIVEDDESHIKLIQRAFEALHSTAGITFARTLRDAKEAIRSQPPDLVVADWLLPDGKGIDLISNSTETRPVPVLMMTSHGNESLAVEMMKAGAIDYIVKSDVTLISLPHIVRNAWLEWNAETTRKRMAVALDESERKYREIFDNINDAIQIHELSDSGDFGKFIEVNDVACRMLRYSAEELLALSPADIVTTWHNRPVEEILRGIISEGHATFETEHRRKDGSVVPVEVNAHRAELQGKPVVISVVRDITERRQAGEEFQKQLALLKGVLESTTSPVFSLDADYRYTSFNTHHASAMKMLYGVNIEPGQSILDYLPAHGDKSKAKGNIDRALAGESHLHEELIGEEGCLPRYFEIMHNPVINPDNSIAGVAVFARDITDRKSAEDELRRSAEKYQTLIESANEGIFVIQDGKIPYANPKAISIIGYPSGTLSEKNFLEFVHPDDRDAALRRHIERIRGADIDSTATLRVIDKGGITHWIEINAVLIQWNGSTATLNFITDITKRMKAEAALLESEARLRLSVQSVHIGLWDWDIQADTVYFSPEWKAQIGYRDDELPNIFDEWQRRLHPDDLGPALQTLHAYLDNPKGRYEDEFRLRHKDGTWRWINSYADVLRDAGGKPVRMLGGHIDITDRKRAEETLHETNVYLNNLFNYGNAPIITWDPGFRITRFNHAFEHLSGRSQEEVLGKNLTILFPAETLADSVIQVTKTLEGVQWETVEIPIQNTDGSVISVLWNSANVLDRDGKILATIAEGVDITGRKRAEELTRNTLQRLNTLISNLYAGVLAISLEGTVEHVNQAFCDLFYLPDTPASLCGLTSPEMIKKILDAYASPAGALARIQEITLKGKPVKGEEIAMRDGRVVMVDYIPIIDPDGQRRGRIWHHQDITERKRVEEEILYKNALLRTQQETSPDGILIVDVNGIILNYNKKFVGIWDITGDILGSGLDGPALETLFTNLCDPEAFLTRVSYLNVHTDEKSHDEVLLTDGRVLEQYSAPMYGGTGKYYGRVWYFRDITKRKRAEAALHESLKEKEVLLKEIHHRVKNNLQIVSGLIYLQSKLTKDPETRGMLSACRNRITSMALLHENLFQVSNFSSVLMGPYLNNIVSYLADSYDTTEYLVFCVDVPEEIYLDIDTGIAVGIIITELATNSIKYAFPSGRTGRVDISLHTSGVGMLLCIRDNGAGIPEGFDLASSPGLGMKLVTNLVRQVHGTMDVKGRQGTEICITFTSGIVSTKGPAPAKH